MVLAGFAILALIAGACRYRIGALAKHTIARLLGAYRGIRNSVGGHQKPQWNFVINLHLDPHQEPLVLQALAGSSRSSRQAFA